MFGITPRGTVVSISSAPAANERTVMEWSYDLSDAKSGFWRPQSEQIESLPVGESDRSSRVLEADLLEQFGATPIPDVWASTITRSFTRSHLDLGFASSTDAGRPLLNGEGTGSWTREDWEAFEQAWDENMWAAFKDPNLKLPINIPTQFRRMDQQALAHRLDFDLATTETAEYVVKAWLDLICERQAEYDEGLLFTEVLHGEPCVVSAKNRNMAVAVRDHETADPWSEECRRVIIAQASDNPNIFQVSEYEWSPDGWLEREELTRAVEAVSAKTALETAFKGDLFFATMQLASPHLPAALGMFNDAPHSYPLILDSTLGKTFPNLTVYDADFFEQAEIANLLMNTVFDSNIDIAAQQENIYQILQQTVPLDSQYQARFYDEASRIIKAASENAQDGHLSFASALATIENVYESLAVSEIEEAAASFTRETSDIPEALAIDLSDNSVYLTTLEENEDAPYGFAFVTTKYVVSPNRDDSLEWIMTGPDAVSWRHRDAAQALHAAAPNMVKFLDPDEWGDLIGHVYPDGHIADQLYTVPPFQPQPYTMPAAVTPPLQLSDGRTARSRSELTDGVWMCVYDGELAVCVTKEKNQDIPLAHRSQQVEGDMTVYWWNPQRRTEYKNGSAQVVLNDLFPNEQTENTLDPFPQFHPRRQSATASRQDPVNPQLDAPQPEQQKAEIVQPATPVEETTATKGLAR